MMRKLLIACALLVGIGYTPVGAQTTVNAARIVMSPGGVTIRSGSGSPEGAVAANPASTWYRTDTGHMYIKITGSGNTGWGNTVYLNSAGLIPFIVGNGLSFAGTLNPITVVGGDDGFGGTAIVLDNPTDNWIPILFNRDTALQTISHNLYMYAFPTSDLTHWTELSIRPPGDPRPILATSVADPSQAGEFTTLYASATTSATLSSLSNIRGSISVAIVSGNVSNTAIGSEGLIYGTGTATVPKVHALYSQINAGAAGGDAIVFTEAMGLEVFGAGVVGGGSSIGTLYGIYIEDQTTGATNYAIYTKAGDVVFNDVTTVNTTETPSRNNGLVVNAALSGGGAYTDAYAAAIVLRQDGNGNVDTLQSMYAEADQYGDGDVSQLIGFGGYAHHEGAGIVAVAHGIEGLVFGTGIYTTAVAVFAAANVGTITNSYGVYVETQAAGSTSNYAVYTNAGNIRLGALTTTGAATGKKVVCVDTATGILYASSTGIDCSN